MEGAMRKYLLAMLVTVLLSSSAFAAGYGDAGCGLGSIIFGDAPGLVQVLAATTNGTSWTQPFGITTGTSNCDASGIVLAEKEQEMFVEKTFPNLAREMAAGGGEHLQTLTGLLGCPAEKATQFAAFTQQKYEVIFADDRTTPADMLNAVKDEIAKDPVLSVSCSH
jgi:hypothetical protein